MKRVVTMVGALALVVGVAGPAVAACSNVPCVATALKQDPVYQDPKAEVQLAAAEQDELRTAIQAGSASVFVALLPKAAADHNGGVDGMPAKIGQAMGVPGVVAVIVPGSFRATSGGGAPYKRSDITAAADSAFELNNPAVKARARGADPAKDGVIGADVMPMLLDFVGRVQATPQVQAPPPASGGSSSGGTSSSPAKGKGINWSAVFWWTLGIACAAAAGIFGMRKLWSRSRKADLKSRIDTIGGELFTTENGGSTFNSIAKTALAEAWSFYRDAEDKLTVDDLDGAEAALSSARRRLDKAQRMANEPEPAPPEPVDIPVRTGKRAKGAPRVTKAAIDEEGRVVINNTVHVPQDRQSDAYPHYFPGGMYGGRMVPGGYYGMNLSDYLILDSILDDHRGHDYDRHDDRPVPEHRESDPQPADTGGGDWGGRSDPPPPSRPAYDPPSTDWGGSGGGSWGGGGDWGGGGGGGGGGDW